MGRAVISEQPGVASIGASDALGQTSALVPFVSELARAWQQECPELDHRELHGTLVFADISGFTRLTERLANRGRVGAEEISDHLDAVLSALLSEAYAVGGWLVKWGGDALLLAFNGSQHAQRGCDAAVAMRTRMQTVGVLDTSVGRVRLRMSIGVHSGRFSFDFVGERHRELIITGDAATVTARLEAAAAAGEILISPQTARLLPDSCCGPPHGDGVLLAQAPRVALDLTGVVTEPAVAAVHGLLPELVLDHLARGGGVGEHRQVAVAFLEFSGMARLRRRSGQTAVSTAVRHLVDVVQDACHRNRVSFHETDISPDGGKIMLVAGAPLGLEDPAEAMLCTLRQVFDEPSPLPIRAGVTSGRGFTGAVGPRRRRSYSVKGDVVNLAARIMGKTPPGEIWALPAVVASSRTGFEVSDIPPFMVKGKTAPVMVKAVGRAMTRTSASPDLPLIGRADEITVLQTALDDVRLGRGAAIDVVGATGIGKTRLLTELAELADDLRVLSVAAEPYLTSSPYSLVRGLFLDALGMGLATSPVDSQAALVTWCETSAPEQLPWLPLLGPILGASFPETPQTRDLAAEFRGDRARGLAVELLRLAFRTPTVMLIDDLQLADEASVALIRHVVDEIDALPWLVVQARRVAAAETAALEPDPHRLVLGPLGPEESLVLTTADTDDAPLTPHVTAAVVARGSGNPLFLRQLARAAHTVDDAEQLPDSVENVVAARIDQLRPAAREVLRAAAVIGVAVDPALLSELLDGEAVSPGDVVGELDEFIGYAGGELRFHQAVMRDAAYEGLAFRRRATLHGRMASLLQQRYGRDHEELGAILSLHLLHAGDNAEALAVARSAGDRAAHAYANTESALLYRRALTAAARLPDVSTAQRAELHESLGDAHIQLGDFEAGERCYATAARLRRAEPSRVARIGLKAARSSSLRGDYALTMRRLARITALLSGLADAEAVDLRLQAMMRRAFTQTRQGQLAAARRTCLTILADDDNKRSPMVTADALGVLDIVEMELGLPGGDERARQVLQLLETLDDLGGQARISNLVGYRAHRAGHWRVAVAAYDRARELYRRVGDLPNAAINDANLAEILLDQGMLAEAETALRQAVRILRASRADNEVAFGLALLGRTLAHSGRYADAMALLDQAREQFVAQGSKGDVVDADAYRAECLLMQGAVQEGLDLATHTLAAADKLTTRHPQAPLLLRTMSTAHDLLGRHDPASRELDRALEIARDRGADSELALTIAAMTQRPAAAPPLLDAGLLAELDELTERLGIEKRVGSAATRAAGAVVVAGVPDQRSAATITVDIVDDVTALETPDPVASPSAG